MSSALWLLNSFTACSSYHQVAWQLLLHWLSLGPSTNLLDTIEYTTFISFNNFHCYPPPWDRPVYSNITWTYPGIMPPRCNSYVNIIRTRCNSYVTSIPPRCKSYVYIIRTRIFTTVYSRLLSCIVLLTETTLNDQNCMSVVTAARQSEHGRCRLTVRPSKH